MAILPTLSEFLKAFRAAERPIVHAVRLYEPESPIRR